MPNPAKPARLYWREPRGRKKGAWFILDRGREISTGCGEGESEAAERALLKHTISKHTVPTGCNPASAVQIANVLNHYMSERPTDAAKPLALPKDMIRRCEILLDFFGERAVSEINKALIKQYVKHRAPFAVACRRELEDLSAALGYAFKDELIDADYRPRVQANMPPKPEPRQRWLTRSEAARLIWAAWRFRQTDKNGDATERRVRQHLARFILVALYTGTRSAAVCGAALGPSIGRGFVDLEQGVFHRRAYGKAETSKRQPAVNLPPRLMAHIRRWARKGIALGSVVEFYGRPIKGVRKGFAALVADAGIEGKVSPHTLRHTAITWALINGASTWDAADYFGVSEALIRSVYGKHSRERHAAVGAALTRKAR